MRNILSNKDFKFPLRNIYKMSWKNDGFRSLFESSVYPEVIDALEDWKSNCESDYVLIGGLALSYYVKPRPTQDIDLIFLSNNSIPKDVTGFKRTRDHAFIHNKHHVEVEVLTPDFLKTDVRRFKKVFDTSIESDGVKVASPLSLIIMKLSRYNERDKSDISELLEYCKENKIFIDLDGYYPNDVETKNMEKSISSLNENFVLNSHDLECRYIIENKNIIKLDIPEFDIYISEGGYSESFFIFGKNIKNKIRKYEDFSFAIKIPDNIEENLEILGSSSDYKSFNGYENEEKHLVNWLTISNLNLLKSEYFKLN